MADETLALAPAVEADPVVITYTSYVDETQLPPIMALVDKELSEPYSIFTYRYFITLWPHLCFLAYHGDECVGTIVCKMGQHRSTFRGYIAMLVVVKEYRGRGIATELVTRCLQVMKESGCDEVTLEAEVTNKGALALYGNLGFVRAKRLHRYYLNGVDAYRLKLLFPRPQDVHLLRAIVGDDIEKMQRLLDIQHAQKHEMQTLEPELLNADPLDVEAQRRIEELIRQKNVDANFEAAVEYNPEVFARVIMLYVDMEVNNVPMKAFVDSGAQTTIISKDCAERCGLLQLLDRRYVGIARGVGQSKILGRIHVAPLKIAENYYPCSFTVIDQPELEFIFGLDMLRKHQCSIDLNDNVLRVGELSVPFLQEKDLVSQVQGNDPAESQPQAQSSGSVQDVCVHPHAPLHMQGGVGDSLLSTKDAKTKVGSGQVTMSDNPIETSF